MLRGKKVKKLFRKILTTCATLVLSLVLLTGCSWAQIDNAKYYNQIVASVGEREFTKKELLEAFNNYGYQYYQNYGYDMEKAVEATLDSMIDRALLLEEVKKVITLTDIEKLEVKKEAFDYMQGSIDSHEEAVRKEWDMEISEPESSEEESSLRTNEEKYDAPTVYEDGVVSYPEEEKETIFVGNMTSDTHFTKAEQRVSETRVSNEAWTRYVKNLQDAAETEGRDTSESAVLLYEEERLISLLEANKYLEKFQEEFAKNAGVETDLVLNYYRENYISQMNTFNAEDGESLYHEAMKEASSKYVYYHPNSGNEYVNVKHILIKFSDSQTSEITSLKKQYGIVAQSDLEEGESADEINNANPRYQEYLNRYKEIVSRTTSTFELDGETYTWTYNQVYNYVKSHVTSESLDAETRHYELASKFDDLIYVFNDDDGMFNSEFDYVVNLDTNVTDQMVKPFADGVRALDTSNGGAGVGAMDMVETEYGFHIIFHDGVAKNLVSEGNINNITDENLLELLCTTMTSPDSDKSLFNYIYDTIGLTNSETAYNNMTTELIANIRTRLKNEGVVIKYYVNNYKDLLED